MNITLDRFYNNLQSKSHCSNNLDNGLRLLPKSYSTKHKYIGLNQLYRHYIVIDCDYSNSAFYYENAGLPVPTIVSVNPSNSHSHILYELETPIYNTTNSNNHPKRYYEAVRNTLNMKLKGDNQYIGLITKNPLNTSWNVITNNVAYELSDFLEYTELLKPAHIKKENNSAVIKGGRNTYLFETISITARINVFRMKQYETFYNYIEIEAREVNSKYDNPLILNEVINTVRSVCKYWWKLKREGSIYDSKDRKVMELSNDLDIKTKQSLGAGYSAEKKKTKTINKIEETIILMQLNQEKITADSLSYRTGLDRSTVIRNLKLINK